jgi:hypothetical protein
MSSRHWPRRGTCVRAGHANRQPTPGHLLGNDLWSSVIDTPQPTLLLSMEAMESPLNGLLEISNIVKILHTYHSRFFREGVAEASQTFLRDAHINFAKFYVFGCKF